MNVSIRAGTAVIEARTVVSWPLIVVTNEEVTVVKKTPELEAARTLDDVSPSEELAADVDPEVLEASVDEEVLEEVSLVEDDVEDELAGGLLLLELELEPGFELELESFVDEVDEDGGSVEELVEVGGSVVELVEPVVL